MFAYGISSQSNSILHRLSPMSLLLKPLNSGPLCTPMKRCIYRVKLKMFFQFSLVLIKGTINITASNDILTKCASNSAAADCGSLSPLSCFNKTMSYCTKRNPFYAIKKRFSEFDIKHLTGLHPKPKSSGINWNEGLRSVSQSCFRVYSHLACLEMCFTSRFCLFGHL